MAAGCTECLSGKEIDGNFGCSDVSSIPQMLLRNGINAGYHLNQKSGRSVEDKPLKRVRVVRVNGFSKITIDSPAPSAFQHETGLRSRTNKRSVTADSTRKRRRSPRLDRHDDSDR